MTTNDALTLARTLTADDFNTEYAPQSSDFQDGNDAGGYFVENGILFEQVVGSSGIYIIETDIETGETIRDSRPWQMRV